MTRYDRQVKLPGFGPSAQAALSKAQVVVIGAGGLGSVVVPYLAGAGVGMVSVVDADVVAESNLHRQLMHRQADVGSSKVASAAEFVAGLNPQVTVRPVPQMISADNAADLLAGAHVVVDGSDNPEARYVVDDAAAALGVPVVWGAVSQFGGQMTVFADRVRYRDVFPTPAQVPASCSADGVLGPVCGVVGSVMAVEVVKLITGIGNSLMRRFMVFDALGWSWSEFAVQPNPDRQTGTMIDPMIDHVCLGPVRQMSATEAKELLADGAVCAFDVRDSDEVANDPLPGARHVPLADLRDAHLPDRPEKPVVTVCASGMRSTEAARILRSAGWPDVATLRGGMTAWKLGI